MPSIGTDSAALWPTRKCIPGDDMDAATVKALLQSQLQDCEIQVQGEGSNYDITAIGAMFDGLRPVKKQQLVYAALSDHIAEGSIHAVNIRTYTPDEWQGLQSA
jgi:acid stress-induced BolA-like protein IbaG/YrbA